MSEISFYLIFFPSIFGKWKISDSTFMVKTSWELNTYQDETKKEMIFEIPTFFSFEVFSHYRVLSRYLILEAINGKFNIFLQDAIEEF